MGVAKKILPDSHVVDILGSTKGRDQPIMLVEKAVLQTDFARYLLGLRKLTQDIPKDRWAWVPYMDLSKEWTDEKLFDYFKLTKKEREHVKKKVQEWS